MRKFMHYFEWLNQIFYWISDFIVAVIPRPVPDRLKLINAKIMAHRGVHDNKLIKENTMPAFERALAEKLWAIELDIRWTKDLYPVVHHDANTQRIFNKNMVIKEVTLAELQKEIPEIPTLKKVVEQFGKKIKLMIELKEEEYKELAQRKINLQQILAPLLPIEDFYLISLVPDLLEQMNCYPSGCYFPIGRIDMPLISKLACTKNYAGILGHYVFLRQKQIETQLAVGQQIGTGFIESKNSLFRELNREVTIISSNQPLKLQKIIQQYLLK